MGFTWEKPVPSIPQFMDLLSLDYETPKKVFSQPGNEENKNQNAQHRSQPLNVNKTTSQPWGKHMKLQKRDWGMHQQLQKT